MVMQATFPRRTLLGAGLSVAAAGALAACAAGGSRSSSGVNAKKVSLQIFGPDKPTLAWFNDTALPAFKEETQIDVELRQSDWGSGFQKLLTGAASGTLADVVMLGQVMTPAMAAKKALLPIDQYLKDWSETSKFYPAMLQDGTYDGMSYALPIYADVRSSIYRSDLLGQVGVSESQVPTSWPEFRAVAEKLAKANGGPLAAPFFSGQDTAVGLMQVYTQLLYQGGGTFFDSAGKSALGSGGGLEALQYLVAFFKDGLGNAQLAYQGTGAMPLVSGAAAMMFGGRWVAQNAASEEPAVEKKIIAGPPLSATPGGKPATISLIGKLAISGKTKDPDSAWQLLSFLTSKDNLAKYNEVSGTFPTRPDLQGAAYLKDVSPALVKAAEQTTPLPQNPNLLEIQKQVNTSLQSAIRLQASPEQVLTQLDAKINSINGK